MSTQTPTSPATQQSQSQGGCCGSQSSCSSEQPAAPASSCSSEQPAAPASSCSSEQSSASPAIEDSLAQLQAPPQEFVTDPEAADAVIKLTEGAAKEIKRYLVEKNVPADYVLRVGVSGGGCSGFQTQLGFDSRIDETADSVSEQFGVKIVMDRKFDMFMGGTIIEYMDGIDKRGFKFINPNETGSCGCGKSFSV
jgi:iron-sulfur cluster assembly protein